MEIKNNDNFEKNVVVFDYVDTYRCVVSIVKQEQDFATIIGSDESVTYTIRSEHSMQITENVFFVKGRSDYEMPIVSRDCPVELAKKWERIFKRLKRFEVFHTLEEANKYLEDLREKSDSKSNENLKLEYTPTDEEIEQMINKVDLDTFCKIIQCRLKRENGGAFGCSDLSMEDVGRIHRSWAKEYLKRWARCKYRFYKLFGENLKIEKEVSGIATTEEIKDNIRQVKNKFPLYEPIFGGICYECIQENKMIDGFYSSAFDKYDKGVKNMTFTKFISLYGNNELNIEISKIYQNAGKTNITISIDPCDYLTVSINDCNWKSCHNFFGGMYANAPLAYMHDDTSLVAFSSNGIVMYDDYKTFKWNNKKWRQMIYVSQTNSAICFSRQYPNYDDRFESEVRKMLEQVYSDYFKVENKWYISKNTKYLNVVSTQAVRNVFYNDVQNGYDVKSIINKNDAIKDKVTCYIGGVATKMLREEIITRKDEPIW